ncbi:MAG TPA: glycerol-3-phosphate dehydrogenase/oxidase [Flavihumibacter sp.]|nr:glycerol-3-phosphate dehydrogenase/oxidase [Flavihumibacter sp.]
MNRADMLNRALQPTQWDLCIIGGGATGLGIAIDGASRGYKTILVEQYDFAKGTSSRSTKLVHGGVRYLQQGNIKLVMEALRERGLLRKNAPHLVKNQSFVIPNYKWWESSYYTIGLKIYDWMAGRLGLGSSVMLSREETLERIPTLDKDDLRGSVVYHDGQFDDARLAINLAQTAAEQGACVLNYCQAYAFIKEAGKDKSLTVTDTLNNQDFSISAHCFINATGIFTDTIRKVDDPNASPVLSLSQGTHLVVDKSFLPGDTAVLVPETSDGRVLFAVPWHDKVIIGTTDIPVSEAAIEPKPTDEEIDFILANIGKYLSHDPQRSDILSLFSGLRPLVRGNAASTAALSRDHYIEVAPSGLISITGGKWTTYRKMAEDVLDVAISQQQLPEASCKTQALYIHGAQSVDDFNSAGYYYGTDLPLIKALEKNNPALRARIHPLLPYTQSMILWAIKEEMCMTVEDALCRRTRAILLHAKAAVEAAPMVASLIANVYGYPKSWETDQVEQFTALARQYQAT